MQGLGLKSSKASEKRKFKIELKTMMKRKRPSVNRHTLCHVWVLMLHGNGDVDCIGQEGTTIGHSQNRTHYNQPINTETLLGFISIK